MKEMDKRDCLEDVQKYIKQNVDSTDITALMQVIEKAIQQNYILDCDVIEVLNYIEANVWGIYHKGYRDYNGRWHDDSYELELGIWEKGSLCCSMIKDAVYKLKKKYAYMQQQKGGGGSADSDALELGGGSSVDPKEESKQPQRLELSQKKGVTANSRGFQGHILFSDKPGLIETLHSLIDNKIGKYVAMVIRAATDVGAMSKPTFEEVKTEFGYIGAKGGYNSYYNKPETYDNNDFNFVKAEILKHK